MEVISCALHISCSPAQSRCSSDKVILHTNFNEFEIKPEPESDKKKKNKWQ